MSDNMTPNELTPEQRRILHEKGTEPAFSGKLLHNTQSGVYTCAQCGETLFSSKHKYDSGSGWPSFYNVAQSKAVKLSKDTSHGMERVEATCANCGGHLGHVFGDALDKPTGTRYCINSLALSFEPDEKEQARE